MLSLYRHHLPPNLRGQGLVVGVLLLIEDRCNMFGNLNALTERDGRVHERWIGCFDQISVQHHPFGQGVDAANQFCNIVGFYLSLGIGNGLLEFFWNFTFGCG